MELVLTFKPHAYFSVPHLRASEFVELANQLLALTPTDGTLELDKAAEELQFRAHRAQLRIEALAEEYDLEAEQRELSYESWTDDLAGMIHNSFSFWLLYEMPGYRLAISKIPEQQAQLPENLAKAARARAIHDSLFGEDGLDFFRLSYPQRFRTLAAMLRTLAKDDLQANFDELLTPLLSEGRVDMLSYAYEHSIAEHQRQRDETRSLAKHRVALRWAVAAYDHQIGEITDRWSQESCDRANAVLKPLIDICVVKAQERRREIDERLAKQEAERKDKAE